MQNTRFDPETLDPTMKKLLGCDDNNHEWDQVNTHAGDPIYKCKFCGETQLFTSGSTSGMGTWFPAAPKTSWATTSGLSTAFSSGT